MANFYELFINIEKRLAGGEPVMLAIDGMAAAGKSTLAAMLELRFQCNVIPMDHFFLRPEQRTPERYDTPGGNIDYERFAEEVARPLMKGESFSYRPFDCAAFKLSDPVEIAPNRLTVVEGVYSLHPNLGVCYDVKVFMKLYKDEQHRRLQERDPPRFERFVDQWLPLEDNYFKHFSIEDKCEYVLDTTFDFLLPG